MFVETLTGRVPEKDVNGYYGWMVENRTGDVFGILSASGRSFGTLISKMHVFKSLLKNEDNGHWQKKKKKTKNASITKTKMYEFSRQS